MKSFGVLFSLLLSSILAFPLWPFGDDKKGGVGMTTDMTLSSAKRSGESTFYTFWNTGTPSCGPGACPADGLCAAIPLTFMGQSGSTKAGCGKCIKVVYPEGKKAAIIRVTDTCPECPEGNIDLTDKLFEQLIGDKGKGRVKTEWEFVNCETGKPEDGPATSGQKPQHIPVGNTDVSAPAGGSSGSSDASGSSAPASSDKVTSDSKDISSDQEDSKKDKKKKNKMNKKDKKKKEEMENKKNKQEEDKKEEKDNQDKKEEKKVKKSKKDKNTYKKQDDNKDEKEEEDKKEDEKKKEK